MNKRLILALLVFVLLMTLPAWTCGESGYTEQDDVTVEQAEYTIRANVCSFECDGVAACVAECVNR